MTKETSKVATQVEEVVDRAGGKVYLPPCQVRCPLEVDIQRNHVMLSYLPLDEEAALSQILKIGDEVYDKNPLFPVLCGFVCGPSKRSAIIKTKQGQ